jgi:signal transduction histidine kinase
MAAEIAHELGTPLNVISGRARTLGKKAERVAETGGTAVEPAEVLKNAAIIGDEVARITKIIRQVLDFSRPRGPTVTRVHLGAVVADALEFLREPIRRQDIQVEVHTMPAPPEVPGDPDQIQQVCLNLITNAIHAMPQGGSLRVSTECVVRRKGGLDLAPPAEYAVLVIADSGPGIPDANREKIFEPFFTTKDQGQGTGLGLAVSHGIVKDHDGWIEVDSPAEGGAVFRVFLPCATAPGATSFDAPALAEMGSIGKD